MCLIFKRIWRGGESSLAIFLYFVVANNFEMILRGGDKRNDFFRGGRKTSWRKKKKQWTILKWPPIGSN